MILIAEIVTVQLVTKCDKTSVILITEIVTVQLVTLVVKHLCDPDKRIVTVQLVTKCDKTS